MNDAQAAAFMASVIGRTVVNVMTVDGQPGGSTITLFFDDGTELEVAPTVSDQPDECGLCGALHEGRCSRPKVRDRRPPRTPRPCLTCDRTGLCADCCCVNPSHQRPWPSPIVCPTCKHATRGTTQDALPPSALDAVQAASLVPLYATAEQATEARSVVARIARESR